MSTCWSTQAVQQLPTQSTTRQCAEVHKQSSNPHKVPYVNGLKYTRSPTTTHTKYHMCVSVLKYTSSPTTTHTKYHTSTHWSTKSNNYPHTNVLKSNNRPHKVPFSPQCSVLATIVAILVYSAFFSLLFSTLRRPSDYLAFTEFTRYNVTIMVIRFTLAKSLYLVSASLSYSTLTFNTEDVPG